MAIELVPLATATATLAPPIMLPNTPAGTRVIFEILDYRWEGSRFTARQKGSAAADWLLPRTRGHRDARRARDARDTRRRRGPRPLRRPCRRLERPRWRTRLRLHAVRDGSRALQLAQPRSGRRQGRARGERRDVRGLRAPLTRQQRGPDDAGRVAEPVRYDRRPELVVEDVARDRGAPAVVQRLQLREPATEHHDVGIEDVDHVRERTAEAVEVPVDDVARGALARRGAGGDLGRRERRTAGPAVRRLERRPREQRLDAAALPAVTGRSGRIDGVVAPLAGDVLRPAPEAAVVHEAAA